MNRELNKRNIVQFVKCFQPFRQGVKVFVPHWKTLVKILTTKCFYFYLRSGETTHTHKMLVKDTESKKEKRQEVLRAVCLCVFEPERGRGMR